MFRVAEEALARAVPEKPAEVLREKSAGTGKYLLDTLQNTAILRPNCRRAGKCDRNGHPSRIAGEVGLRSKPGEGVGTPPIPVSLEAL
jgi:hypothetical protein